MAEMGAKRPEASDSRETEWEAATHSNWAMKWAFTVWRAPNPQTG